MLYTIGDRREYRRGIRRACWGRYRFLKKRGGCVWQTEAEARDFLKQWRWRYHTCDVFGVEADWADTAPITPGSLCPGDSGIPLYEWALSGAHSLRQPARLTRVRGSVSL